MKKRFLACVLATACAVTSAGLAVFTGCGEKENSDDDFAKPVMPTGVELTKVDEDKFNDITMQIYQKVTEAQTPITLESYYKSSSSVYRNSDQYKSKNDAINLHQIEYKYKPATTNSAAIARKNYKQKDSYDYDQYYDEEVVSDSMLEEWNVQRHYFGNKKYENHEETTLEGNEINIYNSNYQSRSYFDGNTKTQKEEGESVPKYHASQTYVINPIRYLVNGYDSGLGWNSIFFILYSIINNKNIIEDFEITQYPALYALNFSTDWDSGEYEVLLSLLQEAKEKQWKISQTCNFDFRANEELGVLWINYKYDITIGETHGELENIISIDAFSEPKNIKTDVEGVDASYEGNILPVDVKALEAAVLAGEEFTIQLPENFTYNTFRYSLHDEDYNVDYQTYKQIEITADNKAIIPARVCQQLLDEFSDLLTPGTEYYFYLGISNNQYYYIKVS